MIEQIIARIASSYIGQQENDLKNNSGFADPAYQVELESIGWVPGDEWCAAAAILVWSDAYAPYPALAARAKTLYSLNSQEMGERFHADPVWPTNTTVPKVGAMAIYQDGDSTTDGHTGIVISVDPDGVTYQTVEGNTLKPGEQGNGYIVWTHTHRADDPHSSNADVHNLVRFIYPIEPLVKPPAANS